MEWWQVLSQWIFPSGNFPRVFSQVVIFQGYFPKCQFPKCSISQVAISKVCPNPPPIAAYGASEGLN